MTHFSTLPDKLKVVVSIINFRTPELTIQCAQSVLADIELPISQIVIVDNYSDDGSVNLLSAWIKSLEPLTPIKLIESDTNSGFSAGHNQAIRSYDAEYYLILNSDAVIRPGFFKAMSTAVSVSPDAGFFAPRLEFDDGRQQTSCFRFHSPLSELIRGAASGPVTNLLKNYDVPLSMPPEPDQVDWASFACILVNGKMIHQIGLMDEGYFLYFEDVAYCWSGRQSGWPIVQVPDATAVHFRGGSGPVKKRQNEYMRLPRYYYASRTRYFQQTYGPLGPFLANLCWMLGRVIAHLRWLTGRSVPKANQSEVFDIWINTLPTIMSRHLKATKK